MLNEKQIEASYIINETTLRNQIELRILNLGNTAFKLLLEKLLKEKNQKENEKEETFISDILFSQTEYSYEDMTLEYFKENIEDINMYETIDDYNKEEFNILLSYLNKKSLKQLKGQAIEINETIKFFNGIRIEEILYNLIRHLIKTL